MDSGLLWGFGLLAGGLLLAALEIILPSGGILALLSLGTAIAGVVAFWQVDTLWGVSSMMLVIVLIPTIFHFALRIMPATPFGRHLFLNTDEEAVADRERASNEQREQAASLVGAQGKAITDMYPIGKVEIDGKRLEASAAAGFIDEGTPVRVIAVDGMTVRVRAV